MMLRAMASICAAQRGQIERTIAAEARTVELSAKRMRGLWDAFRNSGYDWHLLINRSKYPDESRELSKADVETFKKFAENNQRKSRPAHREFIRAWRRGEITTSTPVDPATGIPRGWSYRNLMRHQPTKFQLVAMRQGLGAAISQHMGKVLRTRVGLWVGSHYVPDDVLRDFEVMLLQGKGGKKARIAEIGVLDLYSAHRFTVHRRPEFIDDSGKKDKIKEREMRFAVAAVMRNIGYSQRGTEWVTELGTAAIRRHLKDWLLAHSNGLVTVRDAGKRDERRYALHAQAGCPQSMKDFNKREHFDKYLETANALIGGRLNGGPTRVEADGERRRLIWRIRKDAKIGGLDNAYLNKMATDLYGLACWDVLALDQLTNMRDVIHNRAGKRIGRDTRTRRSAIKVAVRGQDQPESVAVLAGVDENQPF